MNDKEIKLEFTVEEDVFEFGKPEKPAERVPQSEPSENAARIELDVPDSFAVGEKQKDETEEESPSAPTYEYINSVKTTYVPRFTEVSENYRVKPKAESSQNQPPKPLFEDDGPKAEVDPTAEVDDGSALSDATVAVMGNAREEQVEDVTTVFKFDTTPPAEQPPLQEEEACEEEASVEEEEEISEPIPTPEVKESYEMPDPDSKEARALAQRRTASAVVEAPQNVGDAPNVNAKRSREYVTHEDREKFKDRFLDSIMSVKIRLIAAAIFAVLLLVVENAWAFFKLDVPALVGITNLNGAMAIIDLQLVICLSVLTLPEIIRAFRYLFIGRLTPELFIPATTVVLALYYTTVFVKAPTEYALFGLLFAILAVGTILSTLYKKLADFENFKKLAVTDVKLVADKKSTRELVEENHAVDGKIESFKSKTARVFRASFISDFFKRSGKCAENSNGTLVILGISFGVALVGGAIAFFLLDGILSAVTVFAAVFMLGIPAFALLTHKISFYHSTKEASAEKSIIVGESSLCDYSGVDVFTFRDTDVFTDEDVSIQRIALYGNNENLEKTMHQMASLFSAVGGPLAILFSDSLDYMAPVATGVRIESEGVFGMVDGKAVRAGSLEYMSRCGVKIPTDTSKDAISLSTKVMYVAEGDEVYARVYIRYAFSEEFTMLLPVLEDDEIIPLIYTRDPNLSNEFLRSFTAGSDTVRVLKKTTLPEDENAVYGSLSVGIATLGEKSNLINMLLLSKKYVRFQHRMALFELMAASVGVLLGAVLSLTGLIAVPSAVLSLWQLAWCIALSFMSRRTLVTTRNNKEAENEEKENKDK